MIVEEIIQRIQSLYSKGAQSDDSRLTSRHIYNKMVSLRSKLITQEAKQKQKVNDWNYYPLPCVELIKAPIHECPCLPPIGCSILKSKHRLPKPMSNLFKHLIRSITNLDGTIVYDPTEWGKLKYKKGNRYTKISPEYWIRNGYLYTVYKSGPKVLTVDMLPEDPMEAYLFPSYCGNEDTCVDPMKMIFPIDHDMVDTLVELASKELISLFSQNREDLTNTTTDTDAAESK